MDADVPRPLRPQCLEKNLPDVNVDSDSTLGGCSLLSWCGIVSLASVITVCIGGVATHPLQAIRFVSRFIPADPGPSLSIVLCLASIVCIVCTVPVWVPLCMVAGPIFDVPVGTLSIMMVAISIECPLVRVSSMATRLPTVSCGVPPQVRIFGTRTLHVDFPVCQQRQVPWRCSHHGGASDSVFDSEMDISVWQQRQVPWLLSPVEVPQIHFINSVEDTPVWQQRQVSQRVQFMFPRGLFPHSKSKQCSHVTFCRK